MSRPASPAEPPFGDAIEVGHRLISAIEAEAAALRAGEAERLVEVAEHKASLARALESVLSPVLARGEPPPAEIAALLERCRALNLGNGMVVEMRRRHVERVVRILQGIPTDELYDSVGRGRPLAGNRYRTQV